MSFFDGPDRGTTPQEASTAVAAMIPTLRIIRPVTTLVRIRSLPSLWAVPTLRDPITSAALTALAGSGPWLTDPSTHAEPLEGRKWGVTEALATFRPQDYPFRQRMEV